MKTIEAKVVVLGAQAVGKTSIVMRCCRDLFDKTYECTIGAAFFTYKTVLDDTNIVLQIWDTAGQERFKSMAPMYYRRASVAILVYDITDSQSFNDLKMWVGELKRNIDKNVHIMMFGNKIDLKYERQVDSKVARDYAESVGGHHIEMSAYTKEGVLEGFEMIGQLLIDDSIDNTYARVVEEDCELSKSESSSISLEKGGKSSSKSCKC